MNLSCSLTLSCAGMHWADHGMPNLPCQSKLSRTPSHSWRTSRGCDECCQLCVIYPDALTTFISFGNIHILWQHSYPLASWRATWNEFIDWSGRVFKRWSLPGEGEVACTISSACSFFLGAKLDSFSKENVLELCSPSNSPREREIFYSRKFSLNHIVFSYRKVPQWRLPSGVVVVDGASIAWDKNWVCCKTSGSSPNSSILLERRILKILKTPGKSCLLTFLFFHRTQFLRSYNLNKTNI